MHTPADPSAGKPVFAAEDETLIYLRALAAQHPTIDAALGAITALRARLTLPQGTVHVISDIHGEFNKLKHVLNNASGSLRPLVEQVFGEQLSAVEKHELLNLIYYPREMYAHLSARFANDTARRDFLRKSCARELNLLRALARRYDLAQTTKVFPEDYRDVFRELVFGAHFERGAEYFDALLEPIFEQGKGLDFLRLLARAIRNLLISELIVAGDFGDRGPRIDRVIDYVMRQPNVAITWGNHDVSWLGACLGHELCIATVVRFSMRYWRISQLEQGYGIPMVPLVHLAQHVYGNDPAVQFGSRGAGRLRDPLLMARMQKAIAIIEFKLKGQFIARNPQLGLEGRDLLGRVNPAAGTITLGGASFPLRDTHFPTVDWSQPYALSADEARCMERLQQAFLQSPVLWQQMRYITQKGAMYLRRGENLIFHGCVPVDERGEFLPVVVDGAPRTGRALFDAFNLVIQRAMRERRQSDLDMLWYLWAGPLSPLFGKDKMATFENYFIEDKATHHETKNAYFHLIHEPEFCRKILREFGVTPTGLIVNGHVPVKIEKGESPLKKSGLAVTIDGAFSEAYGDHGYTLVLDARRTYLAQHHHFDSAEEAIRDGADMIPEITELRTFEHPRRVADSEQGDEIHREITALERLIEAYRQNALQERLV